ncbi:MAG: tributyrin esterase [Anaerolineales bacterium]|nr:tributyrin esterase [Anaerolineales bacterium]
MSRVVNANKQSMRSVNSSIKEMTAEGAVVIQAANHIHGLAAGLRHGDLTIEGDCGDYLGVLNDGASIHIRGDAGRYLADNMTAGLIIVDGNADYGAGQYCYGGTLVIHGDAGDFTAVMNKGANILIAGNVGDEVATYMLAGDLVILGDAGENLGNYLIRGNIYIGGEWRSLGNNTRIRPLSQHDIEKLQGHFDEFNLQADPTTFQKVVRQSEKPFYKVKETDELPLHREAIPEV